ncbi:Bifunctional purine biosynthetic protein ade1 [Trapelia coarctata]|nr:Bifunctional purine biosynthetic protein ade1 [Trapelia coarctata]
MSSQAVTSIDLQSLTLVASGKVRELYQVNECTLLMVVTDRVSAFDKVLFNGIPDKGTILCQISAHWFTVLGARMSDFKHHLLSLNPPSGSQVVSPSERAVLRGRCMQIRALKVFPIEVIVRGYITGSAWDEYEKHSTVHGIPQPAGLQRCQAFPEGPIYTVSLLQVGIAPSGSISGEIPPYIASRHFFAGKTDIRMSQPSTKAPPGSKDENISPDEARKIVGERWAWKIESLALNIYKTAHTYAMERGIVIADTKMEFGFDEENDEVVVVDELLWVLSLKVSPFTAPGIWTPDSSRFWPAPVQVGEEQPSFDKQHIRDYLKAYGLEGKSDVELPENIVNETTKTYREVFRRLTGRTLEQALTELED